MTEIADRFVVVLDANVLYPFIVRDALLRLAEAGLYRARWTDTILCEWRRALLKQKPALEASIDSQTSAMKRAFPEAIVTGYEALIPSLSLPDDDDRHVLAAAIRAGAQHIVTENLRDFPAEATESYDIEAISADNFLANTFNLYPRQAMFAFRKMRMSYRKNPMDPARFVIALMRNGLGLTAAQVRERSEFLE